MKINTINVMLGSMLFSLQCLKFHIIHLNCFYVDPPYTKRAKKTPIIYSDWITTHWIVGGLMVETKINTMDRYEIALVKELQVSLFLEIKFWAYVYNKRCGCPLVQSVF